MNYPESAILAGLISAINAKLPTRTIYTVPPQNAVYPYILINQTDMQKIGTKAGKFEYRFEPLIQVIYKDISSISPLLTDMQEIHEIVKNSQDITVSGYTVIEMQLINTNRTT